MWRVEFFKIGKHESTFIRGMRVYIRVSTILEILKGLSISLKFSVKDIWKTGFRYSQKLKVCQPFQISLNDKLESKSKTSSFEEN